MENKFNWGSFILGLVIGAVIVGVISFVSKPDQSEALITPPNIDCIAASQQFRFCLGDEVIDKFACLKAAAAAMQEFCPK